MQDGTIGEVAWKEREKEVSGFFKNKRLNGKVILRKKKLFLLINTCDSCGQ